MTIDIFGRTSSKTNEIHYSKGIPGTPGIGFKLTSDGQFDLDGKRLCNVTEPVAENYVVTLSCMRSALNQELDVLKTAVSHNKKRITDLESLNTLKDFDHIDPVIIIDKPKKIQKIKTANENEKILKRITTIESIIRELDGIVITSKDIIQDQQNKIDKLEHRLTNIVSSVLRDGEMIKEIQRTISELDKKKYNGK